MKGQNNFWQQNAFLTCSWRFLRSNKIRTIRIQIGKKLLGFRNMQEKLEKEITLPIEKDSIHFFSKDKGI